MSAVVVRLPGALQDHAGGQSAVTVPLQGETTLRAVLDRLALAHPGVGWRVRDERGALRRHVHVYVDGADCRQVGGLDAAVAAGTVVRILPAVSGGA